jgi:hypothetical protein
MPFLMCSRKKSLLWDFFKHTPGMNPNVGNKKVKKNSAFVKKSPPHAHCPVIRARRELTVMQHGESSHRRRVDPPQR